MNYRRIMVAFLIEVVCFLSLTSFYLVPGTTKAQAQELTSSKAENQVIGLICQRMIEQMEEVKTVLETELKEQAEAEAKAKQEEQERKEEEARKQEELEAQAEAEEQAKAAEEESYEWSGEVLTAWGGVANGPSGFETYYNLPMGGVIDIMRSLGYDEANYPYWVREDGVKMLGDYVMCAADLSIRPEGTILPTSLGMGIVCDTGDFIYSDPYQLDIAVAW
ncbi:MAG: hypothetical protein IKG56_00645 [Clostridia bacterium]|nr:hypothetical protein [Clostridia bacterium]